MILAAISKLLLKLWGWKITGNYPYDLVKKIFVVAPHTSNWDFPLGLLTRAAVNDKIKFIGKKSLFKPPHGWIFYGLGGIPVDRTARNSFVDSVVQQFESRERLAIALAPEGTRKKVEKFKTGYYYIAVQANVPIVPIVLNWETREVMFLDAIHLTGDAEKELAQVEQIFIPYKGKRKELSFGKDH